MRDIGTLVWVVLVIVGVIGSMISSVRKQAQAQQRPAGYRPQARPAPPARSTPSPAARPAHPPSAPPVAVRTHAMHEPQAKRPFNEASPERSNVILSEVEGRRAQGKLQLFANKGDLVRGIIATEVLGKPRALSDEHFPR